VVPGEVARGVLEQQIVPPALGVEQR